MGTGMTNSIPNFWEREREWQIPFPTFGNGNETLLFPGMIGNGNGNGLKKLGQILYFVVKIRGVFYIRFLVKLTINCIVNIDKCDELLNTNLFKYFINKEMQRIIRKAKSGCFLDMSSLRHMMIVAMGWVALPIVVVHRNSKSFCQSYQGSLGVWVALSWVSLTMM